MDRFRGNVQPSLDQDEHEHFGPEGSDDKGGRRVEIATMTSKIVEDGSVTYICHAPIGSAESSAVWRCKKVDASVAGTTTITWAGNGKFNQVATDPTALTYS